MDEQRTDTTANSDSVFHVELAFAEHARSVSNNNALSKEQVLHEYRQIEKRYSALLREVMKITRISDATQVEMRRLQHQLTMTLAESEAHRRTAEEANMVKTEILSIAAHDLKNPLSAVLGLSSMLELGDITPSEILPIAGAIRQSCERMVDLIDSLLDTSALELGKMSVNKSLCNAMEVMERVVADNTLRAAQKAQTIDFTREGTSFQLYADAKLLSQVFDNLVSNAVKYAPPGSMISLRLRSTASHVRLDVEDNGPGLTDEDKEKLFGYFQRLSAQPTGGESSHGVGLAVVKRIVELHDGSIWVESEYGNGAIFTVELPVGETTAVDLEQGLFLSSSVP